MNGFTKLLYTTIALTLLVALHVGSAFADDPLEYPLMAGKHIEVGTVRVSDDGTDLTVEYAISPQSILEGWVIVKAHMYADVKEPKKGAPGRFPFHSPRIQETKLTFTVPLADLGVTSGDELHVAAHAVVKRFDTVGDTDEVIGYLDEETGEIFAEQGYETVCPTLEEIAAALPESFTIRIVGDGDGYYDVEISGAGDLDGTYDWYCIDETHSIRPNRDYTVRVFSSYEDLPDAIVNNGTGDNNLDSPENMDLVNWVMNNPGVPVSISQKQQQDVIWALVDDAKSRENLDAAEKEVYDAAVEFGQDFVPADGQNLAIVLQPVDADENTVGQVTIGQVTIGQVTLAALGLECVEVELYAPLYAPILGDPLQGETAWATAEGDAAMPFLNKKGKQRGWGSYFTYLVTEPVSDPPAPVVYYESEFVASAAEVWPGLPSNFKDLDTRAGSVEINTFGGLRPNGALPTANTDPAFEAGIVSLRSGDSGKILEQKHVERRWPPALDVDGCSTNQNISFLQCFIWAEDRGTLAGSLDVYNLLVANVPDHAASDSNYGFDNSGNRVAVQGDLTADYSMFSAMDNGHQTMTATWEVPTGRVLREETQMLFRGRYDWNCSGLNTEDEMVPLFYVNGADSNDNMQVDGVTIVEDSDTRLTITVNVQVALDAVRDAYVERGFALEGACQAP